MGSAPAGGDIALGSAAQKQAGEAQAQSMSTRGFVNPGPGSHTPDTPNTAPAAGDVAGMPLPHLPALSHSMQPSCPQQHAVVCPISHCLCSLQLEAFSLGPASTLMWQAQELRCVACHAEADPDGAFSKEAQTAAAESQAAGMGTGGSIKVCTCQ